MRNDIADPTRDNLSGPERTIYDGSYFANYV